MMTMTKYQVLEPMIIPEGYEGFYKDLGMVFYDEGKGYSRTPEFIKDQLVKSGKYKKDIVVIYAGKC